MNQRPEAFADALVPDSYPEIHPRAGRPETRQESATAESGTGTVVFLHGGNVANWMWESQVRALPDFQVLTPNLPGFGTRTDEQWDSLEATADDVAAFITEHAEAGPVHLVGLSLGAVVALHVVARHPELASSLLVSGAVGVQGWRAAPGAVRTAARMLGAGMVLAGAGPGIPARRRIRSSCTCGTGCRSSAATPSGCWPRCMPVPCLRASGRYGGRVAGGCRPEGAGCGGEVLRSAAREALGTRISGWRRGCTTSGTSRTKASSTQWCASGFTARCTRA